MRLDPDLGIMHEWFLQVPEVLVELPSGTIFAPTDAAVLSLPKEDLSLLKRELGFLRFILEFHMTADTISLGEIKNRDAALMLNGRLTSLMVMDGALWIDGSKILTGDRQVCQYYLHKIDQVLGI
jgi:uncharacterized surface protein with fasciclin (FAS1) repeats